ncbi:MAG: PBP1A family penicillin-binding protein [Acidobacteriota bacterium]|nr:PBP1A family penicillin-binding protein [Acidobacteriota bacterium]
MIDDRLSGKVVHGESLIFTSPKRVSVGQALDPDRLVSYLKMSGYSVVSDAAAAGRITQTGNSVQIQPAANSYFGGKNGVAIEFNNGRISGLTSLETGGRLLSAEIEPELISSLFGASREKRRPMRYSEFPDLFRQAILSAEDKRFFDHPGLDPIRVVGAAWRDIRSGTMEQGASTITMQVARSFFFSTKREWRRKIKETGMALVLENRFTKEEIFELYANEVYLGNRGSFAIHGFGEAARAYFDKDLRELSLEHYAFLGGIIRAPNRYSSSSERGTERAAEARDRVLRQMLENGVITHGQYAEAQKAPLELVRSGLGTGPSGHFVDMVKDDLLEKFSENELIEHNYRIYTTLDADLQRAAIEAVEFGLKGVDELLEKTFARWRARGEAVPLPQASLVAMDPHTGDIKALVGGRDYAQSQLNRALANRQPGSVFKTFVYAAAMETALNMESGGVVYTPVSTVVDEPTTFYYESNTREYTPNNYGENFYGTVTLREALRRSLNVATVKLAEEIGFDRIAAFAKRVGLRSDIRPTPAVALGAYEMTPLEVAKGYTAFANYGIRCEPEMLMRVVSSEGELLKLTKPNRRSVLDPRIAYMVTNLLEDVMNHGTGAGVRTRGFRAPAAGKTGSSRDGWFAGYTSNLLCVVWIGFDDNRDLRLTGGASAGLVWGEFMKRAAQLPGFSNMQPFERPQGIVSVGIDSDTLALALPECPSQREEVFVSGTAPVEYCTLHGERRDAGGGLLDRIPGGSRLREIFR